MLKELSMRKLSIEDTLSILFNGGIVVQKDAEVTQKGDILIKLSSRGSHLTQVAFNTVRYGEDPYSTPYWRGYDITLNSLILGTIFEYTEEYRMYNPKLSVGDVVEYTYKDGCITIKDSAIVENVYVDEVRRKNLFTGECETELKYLYKVSRIDEYLEEEQLKKVC